MTSKTTFLAAGAVAVALTLPLAPASAGGKQDHRGGTTAYGLVDGDTLAAFRLDKARGARAVGDITGLTGDTSLVGIDFRVQDGKLYGVGDAGGVYTIDTRSAAATKVSQLTVALEGSEFGVDFNPAADRLRVISDTGQNLRHNVNAGGTTLVDGTLAYTPGTAATGVTGAAYTNNDLDADTATTLFDLDTALDQVALQSPANSGSLAPTGKLGVDAGPSAGFDISRIKGEDRGFATLSVGGSYALYAVELLTGEATKLGSFPSGLQVGDLAVPIGR